MDFKKGKHTFLLMDALIRDFKTARLTPIPNNNIRIMDLRYIIDQKGHKNAVQLPISEWKQIEKDLEELNRLRNKKIFYDRTGRSC